MHFLVIVLPKDKLSKFLADFDLFVYIRDVFVNSYDRINSLDLSKNCYNMGIKILPQDIITLMAAGEVIHRPADVLKEFIENALDAKATSVTIDLMQGGCEKIKVSDNGSGIEYSQLELAIAPHATSKLSELDGLQDMDTYGFRGEALHSIAHVSNFSLASRVPESEIGHQLSVCSPKREPSTDPLAMAQGTIVQANQLFAPYPVRRKFLKSPRLELGHCLRTLQALSLVNHQCEFICHHNLKKEHHFKAVETAVQRLEQVFPSTKQNWQFNEQAFDKGHIRLWYCTHGTKGLEQWWFINKRWVHDRGFRKIASSVSSLGKIIIDITVKNQYVDPNLHPQKMVVGLSFYDALLATIQDFLQRNQKNFVPPQSSSQSHQEQFPQVSSTPLLPKNAASLKNTDSLSQYFPQSPTHNSCVGSFVQSVPAVPTLRGAKSPPHENTTLDHLWLGERALAICHNGELFIVDMQQFFSKYLKQQSESKPLLIPFSVADLTKRSYLHEHGCLFRQDLLTHISPLINCVALEKALSNKGQPFFWGAMIQPAFWQNFTPKSFVDFAQTHKVALKNHLLEDLLALSEG